MRTRPGIAGRVLKAGRFGLKGCEMIVGIHHVAIQVADVAAARAFYVDVLGLEEIARPDFPVAGAWFKLGDQQLHIGEDANLWVSETRAGCFRTVGVCGVGARGGGAGASKLR